jgi:5-methylcytosine-specific restriction protein A
MNCLQCKEKLKGKWAKKFCNRSCSATYNGIHYPKRSKEKNNWKKCFTCENKVARKTGKFCKQCITLKKHYHGKPAEEQTLGEVFKREGRRSNKFDLVRKMAHRMYGKDRGCCEKCGYENYAEICHIKEISSFPMKTKLSAVNDKSNIIFLCPTCHWEQHHGFFVIDI